MKSKKLLLIVSLVLALTMSLGGTLAYLTDTDEDVNVMSLGNVQIEQLEYQRVVDENGNWVPNAANTHEKYGTPDLLEKFEQDKPLYPVYYPDTFSYEKRDGKDFYQSWGQIGAPGSNQLFSSDIKGVQDKFVFVKNTGDSDAYVRTWFAFEQGKVEADHFAEVVMFNNDADHWDWPKDGWMYDVEIDGNEYVVICVTYKGPTSNPTGILAAGTTSYMSLSQVYMKPEATNEDVAAIDGNGNGTYDILVFTQAVQTENMPDATTALNAGFGPIVEKDDAGNITKINLPWDKVVFPSIFEYEGVKYVTEGNTATTYSKGGDTLYRDILSDGKTNATNVVVGEGITTLGNRALCKAPTITSVTLPSTLTKIDDSAFQQSAITSIEVPENVTFIGHNAFEACASLEKIVIKAKNVTFDDYNDKQSTYTMYTARDCANLKEVYIYSDSVNFGGSGMPFTNKQSGDASGITFYVSSQAVADALYSASTSCQGYGMLIKSIDGSTTYYNTFK